MCSSGRLLNSSSLNDTFPNELGLVDVTSLHKQNDPGNKDITNQ